MANRTSTHEGRVCMCLVFELFMFVMGVIAVATGKLKLSKNLVVPEPRARVVGAILMLPVPVAFAVGFLLAVALGLDEDPAKLRAFRPAALMIELTIILVCVVAAFAWSVMPSRR